MFWEFWWDESVINSHPSRFSSPSQILSVMLMLFASHRNIFLSVNFSLLCGGMFGYLLVLLGCKVLSAFPWENTISQNISFSQFWLLLWVSFPVFCFFFFFSSKTGSLYRAQAHSNPWASFLSLRNLWMPPYLASFTMNLVRSALLFHNTTQVTNLLLKE